MKKVFKPGAGRMLVQRRAVEKTIAVGAASIIKPDEVIEREQKMAEWATVVRVGDPEVTDFGTTVTCPWIVGQEVYIGRQYGKDFEIEPGVTMTLLRFGDVMGGFFEEEG